MLAIHQMMPAVGCLARGQQQRIAVGAHERLRRQHRLDAKSAVAELTLRHDIPGTQIAWGAGLSFQHYGLAYYLDEINQSWEGPYTSLFLELKEVRGLKVNFQVFNLNDGHVRNYRTVYAGRRSGAAVRFYERQHQMVGPIFTLTVKGTF